MLAPYLEYHELRTRLGVAAPREIQAFLDRHADLPVSDLLKRRWLKNLGHDRAWQLLLEKRTDTTDAELACYQLRALYNTGTRDAALRETTQIWVQPRSQPKSCDPLFEVWLKSDYFTEAVAWQRLARAVANRELRLARYIRRYLSGANLQAAQILIDAYAQPTRLQRTQDYARLPRGREILMQNLPRLADRDVEAARGVWRQVQHAFDFSALERSRIAGAIAIAAAREGNFPEPAEIGALADTDIVEQLSDAALFQQRWPVVQALLAQLPEDIRNTHRWQYWQARALMALGQPLEAQNLLQKLAADRQYYGFWAAQRLGLPGRLQAAPGNFNPAAVSRLTAAYPGIARSLELFAVGDDLNGRREWFSVLREMGEADQLLAAEVALQYGMTFIAISTANQSELNDHVHLRFPVVHLPQFRQASLKSYLPIPTLLAIARQESALNASAISTAGARGLMQLMPGTARLVAQRLRVRSPATQDLHDPSTNIELASYHLAWLSNRYAEQLPLAVAAYNAGEHRVDRWIKDAHHMPMDIWIESIPFRETRNYVKNVLAFRYVYAMLLETPLPFLPHTNLTVQSRGG